MFWCQGGAQFRTSCPYGQFFDADRATCHFYASHKCPSGKTVRAGYSANNPSVPLQPYLLPAASLTDSRNVYPKRPAAYNEKPALKAYGALASAYKMTPYGVRSSNQVHQQYDDQQDTKMGGKNKKVATFHLHELYT